MSFYDLPPEEQEAIHERVEARMQARREFYGHVSSYVMVNLMLWLIFLVGDGQGDPWPMWVTVWWGVGLLTHAWDYWNKHGPGSLHAERRAQAEIEREMARYYTDGYHTAEKRKNEVFVDPPVGIGPDGELIYATDEDETYHVRRDGNQP